MAAEGRRGQKAGGLPAKSGDGALAGIYLFNQMPPSRHSLELKYHAVWLLLASSNCRGFCSHEPQRSASVMRRPGAGNTWIAGSGSGGLSNISHRNWIIKDIPASASSLRFTELIRQDPPPAL
jgi:hypothetical protein